MNDNQSSSDRITLVIRHVADLTAELANSVYEAADGDCEIAMREGLLYIEVATDAARGWARTPELLAAVRNVMPEADLVRVEAADMITAAERAHEPLQPSR